MFENQFYAETIFKVLMSIYFINSPQLGPTTSFSRKKNDFLMFHVSKDEMKSITFQKQIKAISICLFVGFFIRPIKLEYLKDFL